MKREEGHSAMDSGREVDKSTAVKPRPVEMQVLCLGLSRTSTMTMYTALNKLGYRSYHMLEAAASHNRNDRHLNCWMEAFNYKVYGGGKPYGPADFGKILQNYSAVTDMPCVNFSDDLVAAFPHAKVVLTQRDPDAGVKSVERTIYYILGWRIWPFLKYVDPEGMGALHGCLKLALADWTSPKPWYDRRALGANMSGHVSRIRSLVPPEKLLEFHPRDGWEPLCAFLSKEIPPNESFSYVNKGNYAPNLIKVGITIKLVKMRIPYMMMLGIALVAWGWV